MTDRIEADVRSKNMRRIKSTGTQPEMLVRRLAHRMGYRYRLHGAKLPGKPDMVFASRKKVIFVHGCFWHQHQECSGGHTPRSNGQYWVPKLARNVERDRNNVSVLEAAGWSVLVIWQCEINTLTTMELGSRLQAFLGEPSPSVPE
jgi:DNA mismatch endonuclease (patch repair protein)